MMSLLLYQYKTQLIRYQGQKLTSVFHFPLQCDTDGHFVTVVFQVQYIVSLQNLPDRFVNMKKKYILKIELFHL